jgi:serine phosphatase RsbU (regulator of sigma subunit)
MLLILLSLLMLSPARAQNEIPTHAVDGSYITKWLVLGPFFPNDLQKDFLIDAGGEMNIEPKEGDTVVTAQGNTLTWQWHQSNQSIINLLNVVGTYDFATAYAFCILKSDIECTNQILLGSDDGAAIWINGIQAHYNPVDRPLFLDHDGFKADFKQGANRCLVKVSQGTLNWGFSLRTFPHTQPVKVTPKFFLSSDYLQEETGLPTDFWKYHSGDNNKWAELDFDDSAWEYHNTELRPDERPEGGWQGVGWFRLHIVVDSALINKPLGLFIWQAGFSRLYLDGRLIYTFDTQRDGWTGMPKVLTFNREKRHVMAVCYSNRSVEKFHRAGFNAGFSLRMGNVNQMTEHRMDRARTLTAYQMSFTSLTLAIGLLHLILFSFLPGLRQNLFFALFLFSYAATIFFDYQSSLSVNIGQELFYIRMHRAVYIFFVLFQLRFLYSLFYNNLPKQFWIILLAAFILGVSVVHQPIRNFTLFKIIDMVILIEISRVILKALFKKREGAWIIGLAFLVYFFFGSFDALMDAGIIAPFREMLNPYAFGSIGFFIAMSVYLSRDFARANKKIAAQVMEQKLLEAENARQSKELEEARRLQLSMLPEKVPQLAHLDIAVFMKTAAEVGGDYYDFHLADNGILTIAVGDATGHGMKAGTMVASMKSLFGTYNERVDIPHFFGMCTHSMKRMNLGNVYMAMLLVRISGYKLIASAAGMPPVLIYRSDSGMIEEIVIKGMPLGASTGFPYQQQETDLNPGDTILLMSDGFPELFNKKMEMFDYRRAEEIFKEIACKSPAEVIKHLEEAGEKWRNGKLQDDDITFVVLKVY